MEFEEVGTYCHYELCGQHTYLPLECRSCKNKFCKLHSNPSCHQCPTNTVNKIPPPNPIELAQQQQHLDIHDHQKSTNTDTGLSYYKCAYSKCHKKSPISILCKECNQLFCIQHRYPEDHHCGKDMASNNRHYEHDEYDQIDANFDDYDSDNDITKPSEAQYEDINTAKIDSNYSYENAAKSNSINIEVIDTYKFNEFARFGYDDKAVYNAWDYLKGQYPSITPNHPQFMNKMLDILSQQQSQWDIDQEDDEKILSIDKQITNDIVNDQMMQNKSNTIAIDATNGDNTLNIETECELLHGDISIFAKNKSKQKKIDAFIHLIDITNVDQRQEIKEYYKQKYFVNLDHYIHMNFKGIFKRMLLYAMQTEMERMVYLLRMGIKKTKDINVIIQVLSILEGDMIQNVIALYDKGMFRKSLRSQVMKLTADNLKLRAFCMNIMDGNREKGTGIKQEKLIQDDVAFLSKILNQIHWDKKEEIAFIDIFSKRSFEHIHSVCIAYETSNNISLIDAVHDALGNEIGIGYAINCILTYLMDKRVYFGELFTKSMKNGGHKYILFWRVIIDRMSIDLEDILTSYGKSDVDRYNFKHFINMTIHKEDSAAADLISKICRF